jgi:2-polyprenyl-3-methyl-5-hydroxy-6-metoxy-1,4-benzoquinol methylase
VGFIQGDVFDDAIAPGSFNVVLAFNLLQLLEDIPAIVQRVHTLLRPAGVSFQSPLA